MRMGNVAEGRAVAPAGAGPDARRRRECLLVQGRRGAARNDAPEGNGARAAGVAAGGADESTCPNAEVRLHESESRSARHLEVFRTRLGLADDEDTAVGPSSGACSGPEL